jgi:hypothetical protein
MSGQFVVIQNSAIVARINRAIAHFCTFLLAAAASCAMTLNAYTETMRATRLGPLLVVLIALHLIWHSRFIWRREFTLYAIFLGYMFITLLWTQDVDLAMNTLAPATCALLLMVLFGSLIGFHHIASVLFGTFCGFAVGAAFYTITQGFPFSIPDDFSYNAIASMYLFGLIITLMYSCFRRSSVILVTAIAGALMILIVATTSIKTNLGIAIGLVAAGIMYFRHYTRLLRRRILILIVLAGALGFAVASNDALVDAMDRGVTRVMVGVRVLQARDDVAGYSAFETRGHWSHLGVDGWKQNPVFGYGVEAFRRDYEITSHSTPIDLLYNYGLIGFALFYGLFASLMWRLLQLENRQVSCQRSLMFGSITCYLFVSLSGTVHYNGFLAAFIGISAALLTLRGGKVDLTPGASAQRIGRQ